VLAHCLAVCSRRADIPDGCPSRFYMWKAITPPVFQLHALPGFVFGRRLLSRVPAPSFRRAVLPKRMLLLLIYLDCDMSTTLWLHVLDELIYHDGCFFFLAVGWVTAHTLVGFMFTPSLYNRCMCLRILLVKKLELA
jgi:hypothetical protein